MATLKDIKHKVIHSDLQGALNALLQYVQSKSPINVEEVEGFVANFNFLIKENAKGKLTSDQFQAKSAIIREGVLLLLRELSGEIGNGIVGFQPYHSFTCNRSEQMQQFESLYRQKLQEKTKFFYIYGLDLQAHKGIFQRIAHHLEGLLWDYLDPYFEKQKRTRQVHISSIESDKNIEIYKENLLKKVFRSFSVDANEQETLLDAKLSDVLEMSPQLRGLTSSDFINVFIGINDRDWHKEDTPAIIRWFVNEFCNCTLGEDYPNLLFFFSVIYEEENGQVCTEVSEIVNNSQLVQGLPELGMVSVEDLKKWFNEYDKFFPKVRQRRQLIKTIENNLEEYKFNGAYYMEDIQDELEKVIKKINEKLVKRKI